MSIIASFLLLFRGYAGCSGGFLFGNYEKLYTHTCYVVGIDGLARCFYSAGKTEQLLYKTTDALGLVTQHQISILLETGNEKDNPPIYTLPASAIKFDKTSIQQMRNIAHNIENGTYDLPYLKIDPQGLVTNQEIVSYKGKHIPVNSLKDYL